MLYCYVPKAGSTNIRRFLLHSLQGNNVTTPFSLINVGPLKLWSNTIRRAIPFLLDKGDIYAKWVVENFTKMIVVRHPFERLVSFYKMAFCNRTFENQVIGNWAIKKYGELFYELKKMNATYSNNSHFKILTFKEFIDLVIAHHELVLKGRLKIQKYDSHFVPITRMCYPCLTKFDIIAKVETLDADLTMLFKLLDFRVNISYPDVYKRSSKHFYLAMMNSLTSQQVKALKHIYKSDFELFGYTPVI